MSLSPEDLYDKQIFDTDTGVSNNSYASPPIQRISGHKPRAKTSLKKCKILLKDESKLNKKLIDFFKRRLLHLNSIGYVFEWIAVYEDELEFYEEQDITKFPMMLCNDEQIPGINNIIKVLSGDGESIQKPVRSVTSRKQSAIAKVNNADDLKDYFMGEMNNDDQEVDENEGTSTDFSKRMAEMNRSRKNAGLHTTSSSKSNPEVHENQNTNQRGVANQRAAPRHPPRIPNRAPSRVSFQDNEDDNDHCETQLSTNTVDLIKSHGTGDDADDSMMEAFWSRMEDETDI